MAPLFAVAIGLVCLILGFDTRMLVRSGNTSPSQKIGSCPMNKWYDEECKNPPSTTQAVLNMVVEPNS